MEPPVFSFTYFWLDHSDSANNLDSYRNKDSRKKNYGYVGEKMSKKNIDMSKWRNLFITNIIAIAAIVFLNWFLKMNYSNEGSFDILVGAFIEVLILGAYFEFINQRGQKNLEQHLQEHLRHIEQLIKRG
jgi:uncharacterized membrane protein YqhA